LTDSEASAFSPANQLSGMSSLQFNETASSLMVS